MIRPQRSMRTWPFIGPSTSCPATRCYWICGRAGRRSCSCSSPPTISSSPTCMTWSLTISGCCRSSIPPTSTRSPRKSTATSTVACPAPRLNSEPPRMREYVDFLGSQSPYDELDATDLEALARLVEVEYFTEGTIIVTAGEPPLSHFYVVRSGEVEVIDRGRTIDVLGVGETFGQISVLSGLPPPLSVRAAEDTLCYRFGDPRPHLRHPERLQFSHYGSLVTRERLTRSGLVDQALRLARHQMRPIVWCEPNATAAEAAAAMTAAGQSCALLPCGEHIGIVTDSDFRTALAAGTLAATTPASTLASSPAATVGADSLVGDAFLKMVESGYHHLVVTGGAGEKPVGILRVVDLASAEVR